MSRPMWPPLRRGSDPLPRYAASLHSRTPPGPRASTDLLARAAQGLLARAPPGRPAADHALAHRGAAARAHRPALAGRDDLAGVDAAVLLCGPQRLLKGPVEPAHGGGARGARGGRRGGAW